MLPARRYVQPFLHRQRGRDCDTDTAEVSLRTRVEDWVRRTGAQVESVSPPLVSVVETADGHAVYVSLSVTYSKAVDEE